MNGRYVDIDGHKIYLDLRVPFNEKVRSNLEKTLELIKKYANLCSLTDLPPITLYGPHWIDNWEDIIAIEGVRGLAGSSREEEKRLGYRVIHVLYWSYQINLS